MAGTAERKFSWEGGGGVEKQAPEVGAGYEG